MKNTTNTTTVYGFEVDKDVKLTKQAKKVLRKTSMDGYAMWEQDSSEPDTIKQLHEIAGNVGCLCIKVNNFSNIRSAFIHDLEGKYLFIDDSNNS